MSLIAIASPGGAPGATTTAFALALTWPGRGLLAECAPAGGALVRGYFRCHQPPGRDLWNLARTAVDGADAAQAEVWRQTIPLDGDSEHLLLPGLTDPFLAVQISPSTWDTIAGMFADLPVTVLADTGPIGPDTPFPLLRAADLVMVVIRPTLAQVAAARPRVERLRQSLGSVPLALCLIGDRPYGAREVRDQLGDFVASYVLPIDERAARVLSSGADNDRERRRIERSDLMRTAGQVSRLLNQHVLNDDAHHAQTVKESGR